MENRKIKRYCTGYNSVGAHARRKKTHERRERPMFTHGSMTQISIP